MIDMFHIEQFMGMINYKVTEGSEFYSNLGTLYSLSHWNGEQDGYCFSIVYDPNDKYKVYAIDACDYKLSKAYRIQDPKIELDSRAWDDVEFIRLNDLDEFYAAAAGILNVHEDTTNK